MGYIMYVYIYKVFIVFMGLQILFGIRLHRIRLFWGERSQQCPSGGRCCDLPRRIQRNHGGLVSAEDTDGVLSFVIIC